MCERIRRWGKYIARRGVRGRRSDVSRRGDWRRGGRRHWARGPWEGDRAHHIILSLPSIIRCSSMCYSLPSTRCDPILTHGFSLPLVADPYLPHYSRALFLPCCPIPTYHLTHTLSLPLVAILYLVYYSRFLFFLLVFFPSFFFFDFIKMDIHLMIFK